MITGWNSRRSVAGACLTGLILASLLGAARADEVREATRRLASELAAEGRHQAAAIEYRRLALREDDAVRQAGYYWAAAYEYWRDGEYKLTSRMLDRVEAASQSILPQALLLRAETALAAGLIEEAEFYLKGLESEFCDETARSLIKRRKATIDLRQGKPQEALEMLGNDPTAARAIENYAAGTDKSPLVSGVLGIIPGLGFAYCGEYDNALRSLLLNALFIYAMADTASDEQWGAFAAVSFFELTWYTGSIYGAIDAAHRYNRRRLEDCLEVIDSNYYLLPDLKQIPILVLKFKL